MARLFLLLISMLGCLSCHAQVREQLNGIWIPEQINWREPSFNTLYIHDTTFVTIVSAQAKLRDSIEFMVEPGFIVYSGTVEQIADQNQYLASYRLLHRTFKIADETLPGALMQRVIQPEFKDSGELRLMFEGQKYVPAKKYDHLSKERVVRIATTFVKSIEKRNNTSKSDE